MTAAKRFFRWKPSCSAAVSMLLATSLPTGARGQTKKEDKHWSAQWITAEGVAELQPLFAQVPPPLPHS